MCGRYQFSLQAGGELSQIAEAFARHTGERAPEGEICPGAFAPVLMEDSVCGMRWGYPSPSGKGLLIHARAESAAQKPTFREAVRFRRCALPAQCFYEWDVHRRRHRFQLPGEEAFYMAGLWDTFDGENRFVILTTAANDSVRDIHPRMPVMLAGNQLCLWLQGTAQALSLLGQAPPAFMHTMEDERLEQLSFF